MPTNFQRNPLLKSTTVAGTKPSYAFLVLVLLCFAGCVSIVGNNQESLQVPAGTITPLPADQAKLVALDWQEEKLKPIALPSDSSPTLGLPTTIMDTSQWQGSQCGIGSQGFMIIRDSGTWDAFWRQTMLPFSSHFRKLPQIDFSKDMVIGVFRGRSHDPFQGIRLISGFLQPENDGQTVFIVRFQRFNYPRAVFAPSIEVSPFHLHKYRRFDGPIQVIQKGY